MPYQQEGLAKKHGISLGELCSGSRRREIVEAGGIVSWIAVRELRDYVNVESGQESMIELS